MARFLTTTFPAVFGGPAYMAQGEEGPYARFDFFVGVDTAQGRWVHPVAFDSAYRAEKLAARVADAGTIDPDIWDLLEDGPSLEERWAEEAHREALERAGFHA
jgi:hypothetical protein